MKKAILITGIFIIILGGVIMRFCKSNSIKPGYCTEIFYKLNKETKLYKCTSIKTENDNKLIKFVFNLKDDEDYDFESCKVDMIASRNLMVNYLSENTNCELNKKQIVLLFQPKPGETYSVSNFISNRTGIYNDFPFCYDIEVNSSNYKEFTNAITLKLNISEIKELSILEDFDRLEYISISGPIINDREKLYIVRTLNDCVVLYNGERLSYADLVSK